MAKMILVSGCSGVGKTSFSKQYASIHNLLYLSPDNFYKIMNGDERIRKNKFDVWQALFRAIHNAERDGIDCIIDTNALKQVDRDQFLGWFPNFEHHLVYIHADPELRYMNNMSRDRKVPDEDMRRMDEVVQIPNWETLDRRWKSFMRINNSHNCFLIAEQGGVGL